MSLISSTIFNILSRNLNALNSTRVKTKLRYYYFHPTEFKRGFATKTNQNLRVFEETATKWWTGKEYQILRAMNEIRVPFIVNNLGKPIDEKCKLLDVGCGGGILSEPLARLGANVLGIDPVFESINQAQLHSQADQNLKDRLKYRNCNIEDLSSLAEHKEAYDGLIASEVLEHITDVESFLQHCTKVIKPNGSLFITTINQTPLSWLGVIFFGEYVLKQLPKGTHQYNMFVSVKALRIMLERLGYHIRLVNGFMYEPFRGKFHWVPTSLTHYAIHAIKIAPHMTSGTKIANNIFHEQRRYHPKNRKGKLMKAIDLKDIDRDEIELALPFAQFEKENSDIVQEFKNTLERSFTIRTSTNSVDTLPIFLEGLKEPVELRDIAQLSLKGSNLILINLSTMPDAVKPTMKALNNLGNFNPQVEVNNIYIKIPPITHERRLSLVADVKTAANKTKTSLRSKFSEYSSIATSSTNRRGVSKDLIALALNTVKCLIDKNIEEIDKIVANKTKQLLNE